LGQNQISDLGAQTLEEALNINTTLIKLGLWNNQHIEEYIVMMICQRLEINFVNKQRLRCLQILCFEKLKKLNRINEIKSLNPIIYDSCLMKY